MKKLYPFTTALIVLCLTSYVASAQFANTYTAVRPGNWSDTGSAVIWASSAPPPTCNNCQIIVDVPGTVTLNTAVTLIGGSQLIVGGVNNTILNISASTGTGISTSHSLTLFNDGNNNTMVISNANSFASTDNSTGNFDGFYTSYTISGVTNSTKLIGNSPNTIANDNIIEGSGNTRYGTSAAGPATLSSSSNTLPIVLSDFTATLNNGTVQLNWSTQLESNSDHFNVQRSTDNGSTFTTLGEVAAHGNSATTINYSYSDPSPATGTDMYRLQMVDRDGKSAYSEIKAVRNGLISQVSIYPNPARDYVNVAVTGEPTATADIRLVNTSGQLLLEKKVTNAGGSTVTLSVSSFPAGNYLLIVTGSDGIQTVNKLLLSK